MFKKLLKGLCFCAACGHVSHIAGTCEAADCSCPNSEKQENKETAEEADAKKETATTSEEAAKAE